MVQISFHWVCQVTITLLLTSQGDGAILPRRSPPLPNKFDTPLRVPAIKKPLTTYTNPKNNVPIDFYQLDVRQGSQQFFPQLNAAKVFGYDGTFPGPTIRVAKGRETVVRVVNNATKQMNLHLHGSYTRSPWDGWAEDVVGPGQCKDYYYPNSISSRTLWYHDHAHKENAVNAYNGLFGMYQIVDEALDKRLGLPSGNEFDVPLLFSSQFFTATGELTDERMERNSIYGDTWLINGQIQPYKQVEPRKYRFRVLNGAVSRVLNVTIEADGVAIPMAVIGSDGGLREGPAQTRSLVAGMAERWELIVDFAPYDGKTLTVRTTSMWTDPTFADSDKVMQFKVSAASPTANHPVEDPLPARFRNVSIQFPTSNNTPSREFKLVSHMDMMWGIDSYHMDNSMQRILMRPPLGTIERYTFRSSGMSMGGMSGKDTMGGKSDSTSGQQTSKSTDHQSTVPAQDGGHSTHHRQELVVSSAKFVKRQLEGMHIGNGMGGMMGGKGMHGMNMGGGSKFWTHAMHLHLVDMRLMSRRKEDASKPEGRDYLEPYEKDSIKDLVLLGSNEVVEVLVKYQPYPGLYMWHCHNEVHENKGMMAVMNVTRLKDFGYGELDARLEDPMDKRFAPRLYTGTNLDDVRNDVLPAFAKLNAYPDPVRMSALIDKYWGTKKPPAPSETDANVTPNTDPQKSAAHDSHHGTTGNSPRGMTSQPGAHVAAALQHSSVSN